MGKGVKAKKKMGKIDTYESLKALYYSGKVKPSLNKILVERFITLKKNKLFFKYADKSAYEGFVFLVYNRIFKIKYLRYLISKI